MSTRTTNRHQIVASGSGPAPRPPAPHNISGGPYAIANPIRNASQKSNKTSRLGSVRRKSSISIKWKRQSVSGGNKPSQRSTVMAGSGNGKAGSATHSRSISAPAPTTNVAADNRNRGKSFSADKSVWDRMRELGYVLKGKTSPKIRSEEVQHSQGVGVGQIFPTAMQPGQHMETVLNHVPAQTTYRAPTPPGYLPPLRHFTPTFDELRLSSVSRSSEQSSDRATSNPVRLSTISSSSGQSSSYQHTSISSPSRNFHRLLLPPEIHIDRSGPPPHIPRRTSSTRFSARSPATSDGLELPHLHDPGGQVGVTRAGTTKRNSIGNFGTKIKELFSPRLSQVGSFAPRDPRPRPSEDWSFKCGGSSSDRRPTPDEESEFQDDDGGETYMPTPSFQSHRHSVADTDTGIRTPSRSVPGVNTGFDPRSKSVSPYAASNRSALPGARYVPRPMNQVGNPVDRHISVYSTRTLGSVYSQASEASEQSYGRRVSAERTINQPEGDWGLGIRRGSGNSADRRPISAPFDERNRSLGDRSQHTREEGEELFRLLEEKLGGKLRTPTEEVDRALMSPVSNNMKKEVRRRTQVHHKEEVDRRPRAMSPGFPFAFDASPVGSVTSLTTVSPPRPPIPPKSQLRRLHSARIYKQSFSNGSLPTLRTGSQASHVQVIPRKSSTSSLGRKDSSMKGSVHSGGPSPAGSRPISVRRGGNSPARSRKSSHSSIEHVRSRPVPARRSLKRIDSHIVKSINALRTDSTEKDLDRHAAEALRRLRSEDGEGSWTAEDVSGDEDEEITFGQRDENEAKGVVKEGWGWSGAADRLQVPDVRHREPISPTKKEFSQCHSESSNVAEGPNAVPASSSEPRNSVSDTSRSDSLSDHEVASRMFSGKLFSSGSGSSGSPTSSISSLDDLVIKARESRGDLDLSYVPALELINYAESGNPSTVNLAGDDLPEGRMEDRMNNSGSDSSRRPSMIQVGSDPDPPVEELAEPLPSRGGKTRSVPSTPPRSVRSIPRSTPSPPKIPKAPSPALVQKIKPSTPIAKKASPGSASSRLPLPTNSSPSGSRGGTPSSDRRPSRIPRPTSQYRAPSVANFQTSQIRRPASTYSAPGGSGGKDGSRPVSRSSQKYGMGGVTPPEVPPLPSHIPRTQCFGASRSRA